MGICCSCCVSSQAAFEKGALRRGRPYYVHFEDWKEVQYYKTKATLRVLKPQKLFPPEEWQRIFDVCKNNGITSRHHVYNLLMSMCELNGDFRGGVIINKYVHSLRLPRKSLRPYGATLSPVHRGNSDNSRNGLGDSWYQETNRDFIRHVKVTLNFPHINEINVEHGFLQVTGT